MLKQEKERIESLRKVIARRKEELALDNDILYLKSLQKFSNLEEVKYPKLVTQSTCITQILDVKNRFEYFEYESFVESAKVVYIFDKMVNEVAKKVFKDIQALTKDLSEIDALCAIKKYISNNTEITSLKLSMVKNEKTKAYYRLAMKTEEKVDTHTILKLENESYKEDKDGAYISYDVRTKKLEGRYIIGTREYEVPLLKFKDLSLIISKGIILKCVNEYLFTNGDNFNTIKCKMLDKVIDDNKDLFAGVSRKVFNEAFQENNFEMVALMKSIIVYSMEDMLKQSVDIGEYEKRLKSVSGDYAKTYMTKKNIPKKILDFMENNKFLNMFDYVEADEDCELDKLNKLSDEFEVLSRELYLPRIKNHSLRFRKLGKIKALGVYYPGFNTLAIDLDGVSSFIHEMFHMIDFENNLLSLESDFKPLLEKYRYLATKKVGDLGEQHPVYISWNGKSKYNKMYYSSNEEAFARMGELYITEILKVDSSFSKINYDTEMQKVIYPRDKELLDLIKVYYDNVFKNLEENFERVVF